MTSFELSTVENKVEEHQEQEKQFALRSDPYIFDQIARVCNFVSKVTFAIPKQCDLLSPFRLDFVFTDPPPFKQRANDFLITCNNFQNIQCTNSTLRQDSLALRLCANVPTRKMRLVDTLELKITESGGHRMQIELRRISNYLSWSRKTRRYEKDFKVSSLDALRNTLKNLDENWLYHSQFQFGAHRIY